MKQTILDCDKEGGIGQQGPIGPQGVQGATGPQGPIGPQGVQGFPGSQGSQGEQGLQGPIGLTGPQGPQGEQGIQGEPGVVGDALMAHITKTTGNFQAIDLMGGTLITFDKELVDDDNFHDNIVNNERITINTPGRYVLKAQISISATSTITIQATPSLQIFKTSFIFTPNQQFSAQITQTVVITPVVSGISMQVTGVDSNAQVGDYYTVFFGNLNISFGTAQTGDKNNWFSIIKQ